MVDDEHPIKRLRRRESPLDIRFITFSCYRRLPLLGNPGIRDVFVEALAEARRRGGLQLYAWVAMPEHVHVVVKPTGGWAAASSSIKVAVAKRVIGRWRALRAPVLQKLIQDDETVRFWQRGGGFDRNLRDGVELRRAIRYVHRNPVERVLVAEPEEWKWSSVRWWMGRRDGEIECDPLPEAGGVLWEGFK